MTMEKINTKKNFIKTQDLKIVIIKAVCHIRKSQLQKLRTRGWKDSFVVKSIVAAVEDQNLTPSTHMVVLNQS